MNLDIREFKNERVVYLSDEINAVTAAQFKKDVMAIVDYDCEVLRHNISEFRKLGNDYADFYMNNYVVPNISIELTSPGGSVYHGLAIYDFIRHFSEEDSHLINMDCFASGVIASMATIIFLACDKRYGSENCSYMIHSLSDLQFGKLQELRDNIQESERLNELMIKIYTERTKITREELEDIIKMKKDWFFDSQKALEVGLITEIG